MKTLRWNKILSVLTLVIFVGCKDDEFYQKTDSLLVSTPGDEISSTDPGSNPPGSNPPGSNPPGSNPPGSNPPGSNPPGSNPPGSNPPGSNPPGSNPPGSNPQAIQESFTQTSAQQKKVDFLWVIDDSGSMEQEQANLAANFNLFIQDFLLKNVDFKMAVVTTDTSSSDKCGAIKNNSHLKLTSQKAAQNQAQFIADFQQSVQVGITGSGNERGLRASECFIDKHQSILRSDAYLAVVYLSDEEDQSSQSPGYYLNRLRSVKPNAGLVKAYGIVNTTGQTFGQTLTLGFQRYADVALGSNGSYHDIFSNFANTLSEIGDQIINLLDSFPLQHAPISGSVTVKVNGVIMPVSNYQVINSSIKFNPGFIPAVGSTIMVSYSY